MRRCLFLVAGLLVVVVIVAGWAAPASAHATLQTSSPADGSTVGADVKTITLEFNEPVEAALGGIKLYGSSGKQVSVGAARHPNGRNSVVAATVPNLRADTYVVSWWVVSADSHPVHGAFTFVAGNAEVTDTGALSSKVMAESQGSRSATWFFGVDRFFLLLSTILLCGALLFLAVLWPAGWESARTSRFLWLFVAVAFVSVVLAIPLQAMYAAALTVSSFTHGGVWSDVISARYAVAQLIRLVVLALLVTFLLATGSHDAGHRRRVLAGVLGVGVILPSSFTGHAVTEKWAPMAMIFDVVHVASASFWLGGLALLVLVVLRRDTNDDSAVMVVNRFSKVVTVAVTLIVVTGTYRAVREVGSLAALTASSYGQILMVKLFAFALLLSIAMRSRLRVQRGAQGSGGSPVVLRKLVMTEAVIAVIIVAVTAALINEAPTRTVDNKPFSAQIAGKTVVVAATIEPARRGATTVHVYTQSPTGSVLDVPELTASIRMVSKGIGPLDIPLERVAGWHYVANGFDVPLTGEWELDVVVRTSAIDSETLSASFRAS